MATRDTWKSAKQGWEKIGQPKLEPAVLEKMKKGGWDKGDFGKKLEKFDKARSLDDRRTAWTAAFSTASTYGDIVKKANSETRNAVASSQLGQLAKALSSILEEGRTGTQDPKPSGRAEKVELVSAPNAAGGIRTRWLEVGAVNIKAYLVVDAEVARLEKDGEIGYHWNELQKACADEVARSTSAFADTIKDLDVKIAALAAGGAEKRKDYDALVREANDVLKHYARIVEANINRIVDDYWARALKRQQYLKDFKRECKTDIAMSGVAIAASSVSIAMSFGTAAMSALVIAKAVMDIALTLEKLDRGAEDVRKVLEKNMVSIKQLYEQRLEAERDEVGQKASKAAQMGKTAIASALGPISARLMTTTPRTLKEAREYCGKLSLAEAEAGRLFRKLDEFVGDFPSAPEGPDARKNATMRKLHANFMAMGQQYSDYTGELRKQIRWGEACVEVCEKLAKQDSVVIHTNSAGTATKTVIALGSLAKLTLDLAKALA